MKSIAVFWFAINLVCCFSWAQEKTPTIVSKDEIIQALSIDREDIYLGAPNVLKLFYPAGTRMGSEAGAIVLDDFIDSAQSAEKSDLLAALRLYSKDKAEVLENSKLLSQQAWNVAASLRLGKTDSVFVDSALYFLANRNEIHLWSNELTVELYRSLIDIVGVLSDEQLSRLTTIYDTLSKETWFVRTPGVLHLEDALSEK